MAGIYCCLVSKVLICLKSAILICLYAWIPLSVIFCVFIYNLLSVIITNTCFRIKEDPTGRFGIGVSFLDGASSVQSNIIAPVTKQDLYCEICNVQATERNQLQEHLSGARHRKALKAQSTSVVPAPGKHMCHLLNLLYISLMILPWTDM